MKALLWAPIIIVILQLFFRGCCTRILIVCWLMTFIFINTCLHLVAAQDWWINVPLVLAFTISHRIEHMNTIYFVQAKAYFEHTKDFRAARRLSEELNVKNRDLELSLANSLVLERERELAAKSSMVK
jgi:xanthine/uracil permease